MTWIENMIKEVGNADILADMLISENSEWFEVGEVLRARKHLTRIGKFKIMEYDANKVKQFFLRQKQIERRKVRGTLSNEAWDTLSDLILKSYWNEYSAFDIGRMLSRTDGAIRKRALVLNLKAKTFQRSGKFNPAHKTTILLEMAKV